MDTAAYRIVRIYICKCISAIQYHRYHQAIQDTNFERVATHTARIISLFCLFVCALVHALPGIVDGARKTSQVSSWVFVGKRARRRTGRFSSLPMIEATTTRDQCMGTNLRVGKFLQLEHVLKNAVGSRTASPFHSTYTAKMNTEKSVSSDTSGFIGCNTKSRASWTQAGYYETKG